MKGFDIWVFMALLWLPCLAWPPFLCEPILIPKKVVHWFPFRSTPSLMMESVGRSSFACWALTLAHSASNSNQAIYLVNFLALRASFIATFFTLNTTIFALVQCECLITWGPNHCFFSHFNIHWIKI